MNSCYSTLEQKHNDILSLRDLADSTLHNYASCRNQFLDWAENELSRKDPDLISFSDIRSYILYLRDVRHLGNRTINLHLAVIRDFFRYVLHRDWDRYEVPFLRFDEYLPSVPTREEVNLLLNSFTNRKHKAEIVLLYSSGLRVSEVSRLRCGHILASKGQVYVSRSKNRSDRYAVLSARAYETLREYVKNDWRGATKEDWLFPGQKPGEHVCTQSIYAPLVRQLSILGWSDRGYDCHSLRHAFGLHLYEAGTDLVTIKEALGHKSLSSTMIYLTLGLGNGRSVRSPYDI